MYDRIADAIALQVSKYDSQETINEVFSNDETHRREGRRQVQQHPEETEKTVGNDFECYYQEDILQSRLNCGQRENMEDDNKSESDYLTDEEPVEQEMETSEPIMNNALLELSDDIPKID